MRNSLFKPLASVCMALAFIGAPSHAKELFVDGKAPDMLRGSPIEYDDLIGGYQIYKGDGFWKLVTAEVDWSRGSADSIPIGYVRMAQGDDNTIVAIQTVTANLRSNNGAYWSGEPCKGESLASRIRSRGRFDDCMRMDAVSMPVGNPASPSFESTRCNPIPVAAITPRAYWSTQSTLGFSDTSVADWTPSVVASDPRKRKPSTILRCGRTATRTRPQRKWTTAKHQTLFPPCRSSGTCFRLTSSESFLANLALAWHNVALPMRFVKPPKPWCVRGWTRVPACRSPVRVVKVFQCRPTVLSLTCIARPPPAWKSKAQVRARNCRAPWQ